MQSRREKGVLFGSGLIAGNGVMGVGIALWALVYGIPEGIGVAYLGRFSDVVSLAIFALLAWLLIRAAKGKL